MTTAEKCEEIFKKIVEIVNDADSVTLAECAPAIAFGPDWGGNALTIVDMRKDKHTHVGDHFNGTFEELVDSLYRLLIEGKGLSWE